MSLREATRNLALYLGLIAFGIVAVLSFNKGVELLFCVLRGMGAFLAVLFFQRIACGFFEAFAPSPQAAETSPKPERRRKK
jgi:hypothetical protein